MTMNRNVLIICGIHLGTFAFIGTHCHTTITTLVSVNRNPINIL